MTTMRAVRDGKKDAISPVRVTRVTGIHNPRPQGLGWGYLHHQCPDQAVTGPSSLVGDTSPAPYN
jgi:hypothetical protein